MSEDICQLFQFQRRGNPEHASAVVETAFRQWNVTVWIMSDEVAKCLDRYNRPRNGIFFRDRLLEENLQRFPLIDKSGNVKRLVPSNSYILIPIRRLVAYGWNPGILFNFSRCAFVSASNTL